VNRGLCDPYEGLRAGARRPRFGSEFVSISSNSSCWRIRRALWMSEPVITEYTGTPGHRLAIPARVSRVWRRAPTSGLKTHQGPFPPENWAIGRATSNIRTVNWAGCAHSRGRQECRPHPGATLLPSSRSQHFPILSEWSQILAYEARDRTPSRESSQSRRLRARSAESESNLVPPYRTDLGSG